MTFIFMRLFRVPLGAVRAAVVLSAGTVVVVAEQLAFCLSLRAFKTLCAKCNSSVLVPRHLEQRFK